jgi:uncharacterized protein
VREVRRLSAAGDAPATALPVQPPLPHLVMPAHHDVRSGDVNIRRLHATLTAAADAGPKDFAELLVTPGVGARTVRSLAIVAEIVHGAPYRFVDPARFSIAHGGKDRHPFPMRACASAPRMPTATITCAALLRSGERICPRQVRKKTD